VIVQIGLRPGPESKPAAPAKELPQIPSFPLSAEAQVEAARSAPEPPGVEYLGPKNPIWRTIIPKSAWDHNVYKVGQVTYVAMYFQHCRPFWVCHFRALLDVRVKNVQLLFDSQVKVLEMARRGRGLRWPADRVAVQKGIDAGRGGALLHLVDDQLRQLIAVARRD